MEDPTTLFLVSKFFHYLNLNEMEVHCICKEEVTYLLICWGIHFIISRLYSFNQCLRVSWLHRTIVLFLKFFNMWWKVPKVRAWVYLLSYLCVQNRLSRLVTVRISFHSRVQWLRRCHPPRKVLHVHGTYFRICVWYKTNLRYHSLSKKFNAPVSLKIIFSSVYKLKNHF